MKCPICKGEDLEQINPGINTLQDEDSEDVCDSFVAIEYQCPVHGKLTMFYDYDRTECDGEELHTTNRGK